MKRSSGVLMHISSLASDYGIGTIGDEARKFVDFLKEADQSYWQILPLTQTSYGDSPYQSFSAFAGNPYLIDLDYLQRDGLLSREDYADIDFETGKNDINFGAMYQKRYPILRKAVKNMFERWDLSEYDKFCRFNDWLDDYSLFMAIKKSQNDVGLNEWEAKYRQKDEKTIEDFRSSNEEEINFWKGVQYLFYYYWFDLKEYANERGIKIIGDCPIYVALDSADLWANPELYQVDTDLKPERIAGCPPDGFSPIGQLWGNPLYRWEEHEKTGYKWWIDRVIHLTKIYDVVRIDHFRGLASYYSINPEATTAADGYWVEGPGQSLITALKKNIKEDIIAEDLGHMTKDVQELLAFSGYPGMNVLEFAFDARDINGSNDNIPHNLRKNSVVYAGTHDNETIMGWIKSIPSESLEKAKEYMHITDDEPFNWGMLRVLWACTANLVIAQAQDLLGLDNSARMNTPSTLGNNWMWQADKDVFTSELAAKLRKMTQLYGRSREKE